MSIRATRGVVRLLVAAAMMWVGLALCAQAAFAWSGKVQIAKVNQGGNPNDSFAFHPSFTPSASDFSLKGGQTSNAYEVYCNLDRPGYSGECQGNTATTSVTEQPATGYSVTDITCRYTQSWDDNFSEGAPDASSPVKPASEVTTDLATGTVTLKVHHYEWVLCTYTNTYTPPGQTPPGQTPPGQTPPGQTPPGSTGTQPASTSSTPTPQIEVSPARVRPGSARLSGPTGCARSDVVAASVSGRRIVRVTFYVDNKKVKTLNRANRGSRWVLSMRIRGLAFGSHRVKAKIEFAKSSQTKAKTLPLSFSRCHSAATRPQFTG
jgi:hypothetical protein